MGQISKQLLLELYQSSLDAVRGDKAVERALANTAFDKPLSVIAIGKAAMAMAEGAYKVLGEKVSDGLVITKHGHGEHNQNQWPFEVIESSHPIPDENSIQAGNRLTRFISERTKNTELLVLISGGTSALVEKLYGDIDGETLSELNHFLIGSGEPIATINKVRKRLSHIKAGRLASIINGIKTTVLLISDVPDNDLKVIGSGLTVPHQTVDIDISDSTLPDAFKTIINEYPPLADNKLFNNISHQIIADNQMARDVITNLLLECEIPCFDEPEVIEGDAIHCASAFIKQIKQGENGVYIWGGETTIKLPQNPGRGGRAQALALAAAVDIDGDETITLLACGTDGTDGPGEDAGAIVDHKTVYHGEIEGLDPLVAITTANSGSFLETSGDLIQTGPTGTNVMDLVIAIKADESLAEEWLNQIHSHLHNESLSLHLV